MTKYGNLVIDPPWPKRKGGLRNVRPNQGRELDYNTLSVDEIHKLLEYTILPMAMPIHNVWLWTIDQFLHPAELMMQELGYRRHARMIWDKCNGVAPAFTVRYSHEYLIWFYKPKLLKPATPGKFTTIIREPARQHSRKPDAAYSMITEMYPTEGRIDVFSREPREGWSQWGDQVDLFKALEGMVKKDAD